ncbi:MAG: methylenetetrahydrofolate reductase C-terminal domain-containing protein, partial [Deltaproteobacteria bacterium]|nr:methylenetetrahydrofolate reductase C-terminal domain-containing protein [Deltaproteobacteria bacterium]
MIVAQQKDFDEIKEMIRGYKRLLVLGCQTCVAISFAGGKHEVEIMASMIRIDRKMTEQDVEIREDTIVRQCDFEFMDPIKDQVADADAVLSLACGVGVQTMAERFPDKVILPGLNTGFMGMTEKLGVWSERCAGCGNCILDKTGGLCPVARCSKSLF